ncbi:MAG TPA: hypothetical protein VF553_15940 [Pyrinomonadaceae bacterium]|jgi:tetratricopeptide (TPR) repeat protein
MKRLRCVFCLSLLFALAGSVCGQQPSRKPRPANNPTTPAPKDEAASQQRILAVLRVHGFADRVLAFNDLNIKTTTLATLAGMLWKDDELYARQLFTKALDLATTAASPSEKKPGPNLWRRVVTLIARRDPAWARRLTDAALSFDSSNPNTTSRMETNFNIAADLVRDDASSVPEFVERSLRNGVHPWMSSLLIQLRIRNEPAANALFLKTLDQLLSEPAVDAELFFRLGTYVFTSPKLDGSADPTVVAFVALRNVGLGVPDLTADRPGVPPTLVRAYLNTAAKLMLRPIADPKQRQLYYVLGYFMTPKAEKFAPELVSVMTAAMSTLASTVPPELAQESSYANFRVTAPKEPGERLQDIESLPDQNTRDIGYMIFVYELWQKGDFKRARTIAAKIMDTGTSAQLQTLIDFGEAARLLDKGNTSLAEAEKIAGKLPLGVESAVLWLGIAYASAEAGDMQHADEALSAALKAARSVEDARKPYLMLNAAIQYARFDRVQMVSALAEAVREFNNQTTEALARVIWRQKVTIGVVGREFLLKMRGVEYGFGPSMPKLAAMDMEATLAEVLKLKGEQQQAQGLLALAGGLLK